MSAISEFVFYTPIVCGHLLEFNYTTVRASLSYGAVGSEVTGL